MPDEQGTSTNGSVEGDAPGVQVKVHDRRRFTSEGEPVTTEGGQVALPPEEPAPPPDERDLELARQAARIDELTRAYAALLDEGKAARGRMEREKARVLEAERAGVAQTLLEAVDELERARAAAGDETGPLVEGVSLTLASLRKKVSELGAERLSSAGQRFDPRLHDAIDLVPVDDPAQDELVVEELRAGYRVGDRVLRPARVRVGRLVKS